MSARRPAAPAVEVDASVRSRPSAAAVAGWAAACLSAAGRRKGTMSVLLCGDRRMRTLNRVWRKKDRPTDVLAFPSGETGPAAFVGDVAIDLPYAERQASRLGNSLEREVQLLLAHGILHLLGHDHETDDGTMFALQRRLVCKVFGPGPDGVPPTGRRPAP
ncbi:MAG TPA: rRNA maturation RNase YbeY [Thermoanaerobaculia bacterium]